MRNIQYHPLIWMNESSPLLFKLKDSNRILCGEYAGHDFLQYTDEGIVLLHPYTSVGSFTYEMPGLGIDCYREKMYSLKLQIARLKHTKQPIACLYHGGCPDGLMSAAIIKNKFPDNEITFIEGRHGADFSDLSEFSDKFVFIVDFSLPPDVLFKLGEVAHTVVMLDHHITAMRDLQAISPDQNGAAFQFKITNYVLFSPYQSGCGLTWCILAEPGESMPPAVKYIQDGDLWLWQEPDSKLILPAMYFETEKTVEGYQNLLNKPFDTEHLKTVGAVLLKQKEQHMEQILKATFQKVSIDGLLVGIVNCNSVYASDIGHKALSYSPDIDYAMVYRFTRHGVNLSLRGEDGPDLSKISRKLFNGGGHKNASGGQLSYSDFYKQVLGNIVP